jgi:radical SAM superfamily enzyme YgiQ (UPF0313 family)
MRVTLINPPPRGIIEHHDRPNRPHLGIACVAAYLRSHNVECSIIDSKLEHIDLMQVIGKLKKIKPDIVGLTAMTHEMGMSAEIAEVVKKGMPNTITVLGGVHATVLPHDTLKQYPQFDFVVSGEGEHTFCELVKCLMKNDKNKRNLEDLIKIKGLGCRMNDSVIINDPRPFIDNLDELPLPAFDLFTKAKVYPIMTARGCPFQCIFCNRVLGNKLRKKSPEKVIEEFEKCMDDFNAKYIVFVDETFTVDKEHINQILDLIIMRGIEKKIQWGAETRVNTVDLALLKKMKRAGCDHIDFGIESGNEEILKIIKKGITKEQAIRAVEMAKKAGLKTSSFFIVGHPYETVSSIKDTVRLAVKLNTTSTSFGIMTPYPGTDVYRMAKDGMGNYSIISEKWDDYNKQIGNALELRDLKRKDLERMQAYAYLKVYLYNFRIFSLLKIFFRDYRLIIKYLKKIIFK